MTAGGTGPDVERDHAGPLDDYLREQREAILGNESGVRDGDPGAVHDMRVAVRRLRCALRTFRPVLDRARAESLRAELSWLGGLLGAVRDGEVLAERLTKAVAAEPPELVVGPVPARIRERLAARTAPARQELLAALDGERYAALVADLADFPAPPVGGRRLRRLARRALRRADRMLDEAVDRAGGGGDRRIERDGGRDEALHAARRAYKRARYAVEVNIPVAGGSARRLVRRLTVLQDVLGAHQDAVVAQGLLREYGMLAYLDGENAFSYGLLHARQRAAGDRRLARLKRARRRAGKRRVRDWLR